MNVKKIKTVTEAGTGNRSHFGGESDGTCRIRSIYVKKCDLRDRKSTRLNSSH